MLLTMKMSGKMDWNFVIEYQFETRQKKMCSESWIKLYNFIFCKMCSGVGFSRLDIATDGDMHALGFAAKCNVVYGLAESNGEETLNRITLVITRVCRYL